MADEEISPKQDGEDSVEPSVYGSSNSPHNAFVTPIVDSNVNQYELLKSFDNEEKQISHAQEIYVETIKERNENVEESLCKVPDKPLDIIYEEDDLNVFFEEVLNISKEYKAKRKLFNVNPSNNLVDQNILPYDMLDNMQDNASGDNKLIVKSEVGNVPSSSHSKNSEVTNSSGCKTPSRIPRLVLSPKNSPLIPTPLRTPGNVTISVNGKKNRAVKRNFVKENAAKAYIKKINIQNNKQVHSPCKDNSSIKVQTVKCYGTPADAFKSLLKTPGIVEVDNNCQATLAKTAVQPKSAKIVSSSSVSTDCQHAIMSPKELNGGRTIVNTKPTLFDNERSDANIKAIQHISPIQNEYKNSVVIGNSPALLDTISESIVNDTFQPNLELEAKVAGLKIFASVILKAWRQQRLENKSLNEKLKKSAVLCNNTKNRLESIGELLTIEQKRNHALQSKMVIKNQDFKRLNGVLAQTRSNLILLINEQRDLETSLAAKKRAIEMLKAQDRQYKLESQRRFHELACKNNHIMHELLIKDNQIENFTSAYTVKYVTLEQKTLENKMLNGSLRVLQATLVNLNKKYNELKEQKSASKMEIVLKRLRELPIRNLVLTEFLRWILGSEILVQLKE